MRGVPKGGLSSTESPALSIPNRGGSASGRLQHRQRLEGGLADLKAGVALTDRPHKVQVIGVAQQDEGAQRVPDRVLLLLLRQRPGPPRLILPPHTVEVGTIEHAQEERKPCAVAATGQGQGGIPCDVLDRVVQESAQRRYRPWVIEGPEGVGRDLAEARVLVVQKGDEGGRRARVADRPEGPGGVDRRLHVGVQEGLYERLDRAGGAHLAERQRQVAPQARVVV